MSRRAKIIFIILIVVIALALILWWFLGRAPQASAPASNNGASTPVVPAVPVNPLPLGTAASSDKNLSAVAQSAGAAQVARAFAERFGSYSNQSDFENIENLYPFMTERLRSTMQAQVLQERAALDRNAPYQGVTTRVVAVTVNSENNREALLTLSTQRTQTEASGT